MVDPELARRLTHIHRTLELIALLLAVLLVSRGSIGFVVGGAAILLLVVDAAARALD